MAPKSLAEQIADLEDLTPRDYDPEDIERGGNSSDEDVEVKDASAGREHYQAVGKAKLRNEDPVSLGKQYAGSRVSRDALDAESDEDPFAARSSDEGSDDESDELEGDEDHEEDEDEDISGESEDEKPRKSKGASTKGRKDVDVDMEESDDSEDEEGFDEDGFSDEDEDVSDEDDDEDGSEDDDEEEESDEESDEEAAKPKRRVQFASADADPSDDRAQLRQLMATDQKTIAATISQAAKADAVKGRAVKQQRATFDALLNARIKLQKGLTAANQLATQPQPLDETDTETDAFKSAETAALTLWSTLEELRLTLVDAQTHDESKKRKRPAPATTGTPTSSLWKRMAELESSSLTHRRAILDKWSNKVRGSAAGTTLANSKTKLIGSSGAQQTITAVLDAHVASETGDLRANKRAKHTSTSASASEKGVEVEVYDDTIFYQSLLRDLVSQRMSSSDAITNGLDTLHLLPSRNGGAIHPVTGMRKDKVKREIDTRASKGRKMRFDVHEKLQNFMAPEERGTWTRRARDEFFASLLGRSASGLLREESGDEEEDEAMRDGEESEEDAAEGGLRLFRS
ncbi:AATF family protein [Aspergillus mulundensis]|uniref:Protein BFR2 n=1 Tax=Aspergillus mulundensis TaxID=1810919 RepID=A0A3D8RKQ6_9EURO|nr:Protein bfr2 [Aspergillus mulundensis]RDW74629.1 Protein bfr2 [Aspergillus mulundensis]